MASQYASHCTTAWFLFNDTATTEIYTLSLHDALPIFAGKINQQMPYHCVARVERLLNGAGRPVRGSKIVLLDRKRTRLNSSHANISYAVFCLKKNNTSLASVHNRIR